MNTNFICLKDLSMPLAFLLYEFFCTYIERGMISFPKRTEKWERRIWRDLIQNRRIGIETQKLGFIARSPFLKKSPAGMPPRAPHALVHTVEKFEEMHVLWEEQ